MDDGILEDNGRDAFRFGIGGGSEGGQVGSWEGDGRGRMKARLKEAVEVGEDEVGEGDRDEDDWEERVDDSRRRQVRRDK